MIQIEKSSRNEQRQRINYNLPDKYNQIFLVDRNRIKNLKLYLLFFITFSFYTFEYILNLLQTSNEFRLYFVIENIEFSKTFLSFKYFVYILLFS